MAKGDSRIQVVCPSCQAKLTVDPKTGLVVHAEGKKPDYSFDEALDQLQTRKDKSEELFQKAFLDEEQRKQNLGEKFREALDSKDELDEPHHPFEVD
jgi:predicted nucleotide-binding protein (sugar kinase/HSP70/actin superfamily)